MSSQASTQRLCPLCGTATDAVVCPQDGAETVAHTARPLARIGAVIGQRYRIVELIGRGGFGDVFKAIHLGTHEPVALKILRTELHADPTTHERFTAEARMSASLKHPNTVRVFDFGTTPETDLYIAMEYLTGESLAQLLHNGARLTPQRTVHIVSQVLRSLAEAHGKRIVHRDLKPDNVVVGELAGEQDFVRVIDFGIAKFVREGQQLTQAGAIVGTPHYMSPEQVRGEALDGRSDLYALGVLMFRCLTGQLPFEGDNSFAVLAAHLSERPAPMSRYTSSVDPVLDRIVLRALEKDPAHRFHDAEQMRAALDAWRDALATQPQDDAAAEMATMMAMDVLTPERIREIAAGRKASQNQPQTVAPEQVLPAVDEELPPPIPDEAVQPLAVEAVADQGTGQELQGQAYDPDATRVELEANPEPARRPSSPGQTGIDSGTPSARLRRKPRASDIMPAADAAAHGLRVIVADAHRVPSEQLTRAGEPIPTADSEASTRGGIGMPVRGPDQLTARAGRAPAKRWALALGVLAGLLLAAILAQIWQAGQAERGVPALGEVEGAGAEPGTVPPAAVAPVAPADRAGPQEVEAPAAKTAAEARPVAAPPAVAPDPCAGTAGSVAWCLACPAARSLAATDAAWCPCRAARGEMAGAEWYCRCVFREPDHAPGSPTWCRCHAEDARCPKPAPGPP